MKIFDYMLENKHEQLSLYHDSSVGLKAIIAIHNTILGPACGGTRIWSYSTEDEAILDALKLSRAMTYKSAIAKLSFGGGKGVIIANRTEKTKDLLMSYGSFINTFNGRYITTSDLGTTNDDLINISKGTSYILGVNNDTAPLTGLGIYVGMKACAQEIWGVDSLNGKKIAIQGFGKVAFALSQYLLAEHAKLIVADIYDDAVNKARLLGCNIVAPHDIYDAKCDIFAPCAVGGVLTANTIDRLNCKIVVGGANNQLLTNNDGIELFHRNILYAPDYVVNAGGIISIAGEIYKEDGSKWAKEKTEDIYQTMREIISIAKEKCIAPFLVANQLAEEYLAYKRIS